VEVTPGHARSRLQHVAATRPAGGLWAVVCGTAGTADAGCGACVERAGVGRASELGIKVAIYKCMGCLSSML
jgi:hypothetical protein